MSRDATTDVEREPVRDWSAVLSSHARWLRTVLLARSADAAAVEELFQDLALAVVQRPPLHVPEVRLPAWLYGAAVKLALLHRRKCGRLRRAARLAGPGRPEPSAAPDPLGWLLATERDQLVRSALERLAPKDRELLLLKYTQDWSYLEIADHLGVSVSSVETRLHRARGRLRQELSACQITEVHV